MNLLAGLFSISLSVRRLSALIGGTTFARMILMTVLPLKALEVMGGPQFVSGTYFVVGCVAISTSLALPSLVRIISRDAVFMLGVLCLALCLLLLATMTPLLFGLGLAIQAMGVVIIEITISLYALDAFKRHEFLSYEPVRMFLVGLASVLGPWLGVYASVTLGAWAAYALSGLVVIALGVYFLVVRGRLAKLVQVHQRRADPLRHVREFFAQKRMLLAYLLATGRSAWWMTFYVYMPIFARQLGFDDLQIATLVSLSMVSILCSPFWGAVARRYGTRPVVVGGYILCGSLTIAAGLLQSMPWVAVGFFVLASFSMSILDGPGNVFFLRAVRPLRRAEMTSTFSTYRDVGQTVPQLVYALLLVVFHDLSVVLLAAGASAVALGILARHLPRGI